MDERYTAYLLRVPLTKSNILSGFEQSQHLLACIEIELFGAIDALHNLFKTIDLGTDSLNVLQTQFLRNDLHVTNWIHSTLDVRDICILEHARHMEDTVDGTDVREEGIAQTLSLVSSSNQTSNIGDAQVCRNSRCRLMNIAQEVESRVGNLYTTWISSKCTTQDNKPRQDQADDDNNNNK
jgi:hypothetical protein